MKIIGAGMPRTGTMSMQSVLDQLGFPCYHMESVARNSEHLKRWDAFSLVKTDFFQRALPWTELILHDQAFVNDLNLQTSSRLSVALTFGLVAALPLARRAFVSAIIGLLASGLFVLNVDLYQFFWRKRGFCFMLRAIAWHWFYYFYSGLAFAFIFVRLGPHPPNPLLPTVGEGGA